MVKLRETPLLHMPLRDFMGRDLLMVVLLWLQFSCIYAEANTTSWFQEIKTSFFPPQLLAKQEVLPYLKSVLLEVRWRVNVCMSRPHSQKTTEGEKSECICGI